MPGAPGRPAALGRHARPLGRGHHAAAQDAARLRLTPEGGGPRWSVPADLATGPDLPVAAIAHRPGPRLGTGNQRQPAHGVGTAADTGPRRADASGAGRRQFRVEPVRVRPGMPSSLPEAPIT